MQVLYIDVLFLLNFMVDCLLIGLTAMLRGYFLPIGRRLWGSVVGALLAVLAFFLPDALPSSLWAAVSCALMLLAAWGWKGKRRFAADCAMLWVLSMVFSGGTMLMAQWYGGMARGNAIYLDISVPILLGGTGTAYGLLTLCCRPGSVQAERRIHKIRCRLNGREICFSAFADTGNLLRDPVGRAVLLLSPSLAAELLGEWPLPAAEQCFMQLTGRCNTGLLPCRTAGGDSLLVTVQPDVLEIDGKVRQDTILGLAAQELEGMSGCRALIGC